MVCWKMFWFAHNVRQNKHMVPKGYEGHACFFFLNNDTLDSFLFLYPNCALGALRNRFEHGTQYF